MNLASFDIFDTTLIRKCGKPENVFWLLAKRLFPNDTDRQQFFVVWRNSSSSREWGDDYDSIDDIYEDEFCSEFINKSSSILKNEERLIESELLVANKEILSIIENYRSKGYTIAFISDMYLDSAFLKNVLIREGAYKEGDYIYVSNECKARKDNGELYDYVRNCLHPSKWFHYGDNKLSDYIKAREKNINATLISQNYHPSECDVIGISKIIPNSCELSSLAGFSRSARLKFGNSAHAILAADLVAPAYIPYVLHILHDARQKKIETLFFLSRDAYILYQIAEQVPHDGIDLRFLFVSRKALTLPFLYNNHREDYLRLFPKHSLRGKSVKKLLSELELTSDNIQLDFTIIESEEQEQKFLDKIFADEMVYKRWQIKAEEKHKLACGYLEQEGVFSDNIALVDVGWYGSTRMMINKFRKLKGKLPCFSYYWGKMNSALSSKYGEYSCFNKGLILTQWLTYLVEDYFSNCPYPSTVGYNCVDNRYIPDFDSNKTYEESYVYKTNRDISLYLLKMVMTYHIDSYCLYVWAISSFNSINSNRYYIDYCPLIDVGGKDEFVFRKISLFEIPHILLSRSITVNDVAALDLSFGIKTRKMIIVGQKVIKKVCDFLHSIQNNSSKFG